MVVCKWAAKIRERQLKPPQNALKGGSGMDEVTLQKLAAAIYEMLPPSKIEALTTLGFVAWLVEAKWGRSGGEVVQLDLAPRSPRKATEKLDNLSA